MYCVQFKVDVNVPGTYNTDVTLDGKINGTVLTNAGEVSWLVTNLAPTAKTADEQSGLQAAIWYEVAGGGLGGFRIGSNTGQINADYLADLKLLGITSPDTSDGSSATVAPISNLLYLTPFNADGSAAQGQVAARPRAFDRVDGRHGARRRGLRPVAPAAGEGRLTRPSRSTRGREEDGDHRLDPDDRLAADLGRAADGR